MLPSLLLLCATRGAALVLPARAPVTTRLRAAVLDPLNAEDLGDSATVPELAEAVAHKGAADVTALSLLEEIRSLKFFSLYSIDLLANCAYLGGAPEECEFDACEVRTQRPVVWRRLHFLGWTRGHLTMPWVVSFLILSPFAGPTGRPRTFTFDGAR